MAPIHHSQVVTAWLPIRSTFMDRDQPNVQVVDECIGAFLNSLPRVLPLLVAEVSEVVVAEASPPPEVMSWLSRNSSLLKTKLFRIFSVSATVTYIDNLNSLAPGDDTRFLSANAAFYLERAISCCLPLAELAYPGTILAAQGVIVDELGLLSDTGKQYFLSCARPYHCNSTAWPLITLLDLYDVAIWAKSIGFPGSSFATTRLQRALAAFTHVIGLGWGSDGETLFRAMQGLEAFYCDGVGDLRRQLAHKSEVWLGPSQDKRNIVGKLYDHRSKFIHGSAKMLYRNSLGAPEEEDGKTIEEFTDAVDFSTRLLLASLQRCVTEQVADVNWTYSCDLVTLDL